MTMRDAADWTARNQDWLAHEVRQLHARIEARLGAETEAAAQSGTKEGTDAVPPVRPALERCVEVFGLSPFERELLLLVAGVELDSTLRQLVQRAQAAQLPSVNASQPCFSFALRVLDDPHWDALSPQAPLRRWRLIDFDGAGSLTRQALRINERVLHYLTGVSATDERLFGLLRPTLEQIDDEDADTTAQVAHALHGDGVRVPIALLVQSPPADREALRRAAASALLTVGCSGLWVRAGDLPASATELAELALLLDREAIFARALPVIELDDDTSTEATHEQRALTLVAHLQTPTLVLGAIDPARHDQLPPHHTMRVDVPAPGADALRERARRRLGDHAHAGALDEALRPALRQFQLSTSLLEQVIAKVASDEHALRDASVLADRLWSACREHARGGLDTLAQRVESQATFSDLVLPPAQLQMVREIAEHLKHRHTVFELWQMHGGNRRGQGLCALFAGESGTGKTLAAEAIATEVGLDLYRIDLSTVVSKYIGETEKNLRRLFDAAEHSGAVLLFDEADALFGKRSEVKDSHDRYANIEVAYLLQRIEAYRGLAILTTNLKTALDRSFLRRIRFIVQFPFPDAAARAQIWCRMFGAHAPTRGLEPQRLAGLALSGGSIRNVAVNAAFIAAAGSGEIDTAAIQAAARAEFAKLDRPSGDVRLEA